MKQQPFLLSILLFVHSHILNAQPKTPEDFAPYFGRSKDQVFEIRRENTDFDPPYGEVRIYAVVVGVSQYTAMRPLRFTDDDAWLFYAHLTSEEGGELTPDQITLLLEEDATRENIAQALREMSSRADANDVIIFYFSGHGLSQAFIPIDFDGYSNQLSHREVLQILQDSPARHKLCIADACHSGAFDYGNALAAKGANAAQIRHFYKLFEEIESGTALLMSSSAEEASLEARELHHGVFTHFLLRGIGGKADHDHDGIVNIKELFWYVHHHVLEYTEGAQSPVLTGNYDDDLPVAIRNAD